MLLAGCKSMQLLPHANPHPLTALPAGVNYTRTACVIAVSKAKDLFEPFLHQLGYRLAHVQRRMLPIAMHLLQVHRGRWAGGWGGGLLQGTAGAAAVSSRSASSQRRSM